MPLHNADLFCALLNISVVMKIVFEMMWSTSGEGSDIMIKCIYFLKWELSLFRPFLSLSML